MVERILDEVRQGRTVCAAFPGHPGVGVYPTREALRQARAEGLKTRMNPSSLGARLSVRRPRCRPGRRLPVFCGDAGETSASQSVPNLDGVYPSDTALNTKTQRHQDTKKARIKHLLIAGLLGVLVPLCLCV